MAEATFHITGSFLWGTASASHQVEGQNTKNNWYRWEQEGHILDGSQAGLACDWWGGRWREDFDRAAETGQNAHRLSIEWSRIQPDPDRWDEDALDHYRKIVRGAKERGLTPMVTLHHFTDPIWLADMGGWENDAVIQLFQAYVQKVVESLQDTVSMWCTINEPNTLNHCGYLLGIFPPGRRSVGSLYRVMQNQIKAHAQAYHTIHRLQPVAQVGLAHHYRAIQPAKGWSPMDRYWARAASNLFNDSIPAALKTGVLRFLGIRKSIPEAKGTQDFFGLNYYSSELAAFDLLKPTSLFANTYIDPESDISPNGFITNQPKSFFRAMRWAAGFGLPVYITENGVEDADDGFRRKYLIQHIHNLWRAVNYNLPVRGYFHWTLVDNFEWERGWSQRFGLWALDTATQSRQKRQSAELYEAICKQSSLSSEMVSNHAPELMETMFPG